MKIAFFGLPLAGVLLHLDGHEIVLAGLPRVGSLGTRRLRRAIGASRVLERPDLADVARRLEALAPDLVVSWFWTTNLPPTVRAQARVAAFGVHPSLLPRHRGPDPYYWTILEGDRETGVSAHMLADEYDTGAVLAQRTLAVDPSWNAWTLARALDRPSLALLREIANAYARGVPPGASAQDETKATPAQSPSEDDLEIDWNEPVESILRSVRAAAPYPGAYTFFGNEAVTVVSARAEAIYPRALEPGEAFFRERCVFVRAKDGAIAIDAARVFADHEESEEQELDGAALWARLYAEVGSRSNS